jgi:hypothetical protein
MAMKPLAVVLFLLGCAACGENEVSGPTTDAVAIAGRVIDFFSRQTRRSVVIEYRTTAGSPVTATTTDSSGQYSATLPRGGDYLIFVNGNASGITYVGGVGYRGDLVIDDGRCVVRYGTVTDTTGRPLRNATVAVGAWQAVSASDGWYSIEFGCPSNGTIGDNTIQMNVSVSGYSSWVRFLGPGITGVQRFDVALRQPQD